MFDEEEKKKREEEAKLIISSNSIGDTINSINYANSNNYKINTNNDNEKEFINRINEANSIINSINPRQNVAAPSVSEEDSIKSRETAVEFLKAIDNNATENDITNSNSPTVVNTSSEQRKNQIKTKEQLDKQIAKANNQSVTVNNNKEKNIVDKDIKIGLANSQETENAQELSTLDLQVMKQATKKNENIEKGGIEAFNEWADTTLNNILGGAKQSVAGLADVATTIMGFGIKGLEGASSILGLTNTAEALGNAYNKIIGAGSSINEKANYERTVNSQVTNDFVKTSGDVSNVISNMLGNTVIGYATGVSGTVVQGLSVGGSSAQEVLDENKNNIGQATLTGVLKGYTSYLTEKMFDANILTRGTKKTSIQEGINRIISNKINSKFGKEIANRTVGILGENVEELVEDNAGYLIDKLVNNKDLPGFEQWWNNTTETVKTTSLTTLIMGLLGLGGESFDNIEMDMETEYWLDQAQQIIEQEDLAIHFNPNEIIDTNNTKQFYITRISEEGEIANIVPTNGKPIYNARPELNVMPVIVKDNKTNYYNVIDGNTGVVLDNTYYNTTMEAEVSFNEKINKLSDLQLKDINTKIDEANYLINDKIIATISEAQEQLSKNNTHINQENNLYTEQQYNDIVKLMDQISDKSVYNKVAAKNVFKAVDNNIRNISVVSEDGVNYIKSYDNSRNETYKQKINNKVYTGKRLKEIVNTAIEKADYNASPEKPNTNTTQTSSDPNRSSFYTAKSNYAVEDIKKVTEPFNTKKEYSMDEMAEIWNNEISKNEYDVTYDNNGNIKSYIAIEEDNGNLVVYQYDNEDNIVKSEAIPANKGKYTSKAIKDTLEKVSSIYDENRPIKGQQDIEGNEVRSLRTNNNAQPKTQYKNATDLIKGETQKAEKNFKTDIKIDAIDKLENTNFDKISENDYIKLSKEIYKEYIEKRAFYNDNAKINIKVVLSDIKESAYKAYNSKHQSKLLKEHIQALSQIDKIIKTGKEVSTNSETKNRTQYKNWRYFSSQATIENKPFLVQFDVTEKSDGYHFRLQRLVELHLKNNKRAVASTLTNKQVGVDSRQQLNY